MEEFIDTVLMKMTQEISLDYAAGKRTIATVPTIAVKTFRESSLWMKKARYIKGDVSADTSTYFVAASQLQDEVTFNDAYIQEQNNFENYRSLDEYREKRFAKFWTTALHKSNEWNTRSHCDCPSFLKNYYCKHVIGLALGNRLCELPKKALTTEIKKVVAKKTGRVPKATPALQK